jgi:hypothetical protein
MLMSLSFSQRLRSRWHCSSSKVCRRHKTTMAFDYRAVVNTYDAGGAVLLAGSDSSSSSSSCI